eukprot:gnl/TRDRNA2_/TRDRNA2_36412_c0_seq1.p1 gnl/TRDRNA2_/TRDRNA2_36412_c0~~gnl/TRDRNA2_/TRDRNA2_36412_c0_seq1.p1  ORF type:complete len:256 (+),score=48.71 gnl/TRDRNA2_/TRDRNA2_36412_c0_seq1:127-894(+)
METHKAFKVTKFILRVLGAGVCIAFAFQGVWLFTEPKVDDFWEFCHWIGSGFLGIIVGASGCYLEVRGSMSSVTKHCAKFALNRLGLSIFYFWLGCYVMGGVANSAWKTLGHITGIVSWVVAVGDLFTSCASETLNEEEENLRQQSNTKASTTKFGRTNDDNSGAINPAGEIQWANTGSMPALPAAGAQSGAGGSGTATFGAVGGGTNAFGSTATGSFGAGAASPTAVQLEEPTVTPEGGWSSWNSSASKPFGCS